MLKIAQKRQQLIVWLESPDRSVQRGRLLERIFLERKVRVKVDLSSLDRLVPEPKCNHRTIHTGLQLLHGSGVPQNMW